MTGIARQVRVTGRVQGVGFRAWTARRARALGLDGWVRNEPDGSVAALIAGPPDAVAAMLAELRRGPPAARVERMESAPADPPALPGFTLRG
ncbi:MAG: acylphosphatase [Rhodobacteraceae bacterium]|nr:acylphosphatase [Paracoccaceae bacterium]